MPAVTTDNILALPRVAVPDPATAVQRPVRSVTTAPRGAQNWDRDVVGNVLCRTPACQVGWIVDR